MLTRTTNLTDEMVRKYQSFLLLICYCITRDRDRMWDLAQNVWLRILRYGVCLPQDERGATKLLARIARNDFLSSCQRRPEAPLRPDSSRTAPDPYCEVERADFMERLQAIVSAFPVPEQTVFWARQELPGWSWELIAEALGIPVHTAKKRYGRALRRLRTVVPCILL